MMIYVCTRTGTVLVCLLIDQDRERQPKLTGTVMWILHKCTMFVAENFAAAQVVQKDELQLFLHVQLFS